MGIACCDGSLKPGRWLTIAGALGWAYATTGALAIRAPVLDALGAIVRAELTVGTVSVSLADALAFVLVLVVGFSIILTSDVPGNRLFGMLACTAIGTALIGDLVVLPAMLACFVKRRDEVL